MNDLKSYPRGGLDLTGHRGFHVRIYTYDNIGWYMQTFPNFFLKFLAEISLHPMQPAQKGVTGALRAQPSAVSFRPYEPNRFFLRGPTWPRMAFFWMPFGQRCCVRICTMFLAYSWAKPMGDAGLRRPNPVSTQPHIQTKGAVQIEPPPNGCSFQDAVAKFSARQKYAQTSQKSTDKIMQCFRSSRGVWLFLSNRTSTKFQTYFQHN